MNGFYVSMIFLGILLVLVSLLFIAFDKKKVFNFTKTFDDKKQQLTEIINDAEQMIEELNKFSDYIVNQMDLKNKELDQNLKNAEDKVLALGERVKAMSVSTSAGTAANPAEDCSSVQPPVSIIQASGQSNRAASIYRTKTAKTKRKSKNVIIDEAKVPEDSGNMEEIQKAAERHQKNDETEAAFYKKNNVVPLRNKYSEVLSLSRQGIESLDIARMLNLGKGEVELIIGLRSEQLQ